MKYEFQFLRKDMQFYVDVEADNKAQAVERANTINHDFTLAPEFDGAENSIKRVVLRWPEEFTPFTQEDIAFIFDLENRQEIGDFSTVP